MKEKMQQNNETSDGINDKHTVEEYLKRINHAENVGSKIVGQSNQNLLKEIKLDHQRLMCIGFAINCFDILKNLEQTMLPDEDWVFMERQFVLACLSESGFGIDRKGLIDNAYTFIKETLAQCLEDENYKQEDKA